MAFHRDVLEKLKGFRGVLRCAEGMDMAMGAGEAGHAIFYETDSLVMHHHVQTRFRNVFSYFVYHGLKAIILRQRYRDFMRTPIVLRSPVLLLLGAPLIALVNCLGVFLRNPRMAQRLHTAPVVYILKLAWCWGAVRGLIGRGADV